MILLVVADQHFAMSGTIRVFTFMGPLLMKLTGAGPDAVGLVFAIYGGIGFVGIAIATASSIPGAYKSSLLFTSPAAHRGHAAGRSAPDTIR